MNVRDAIDRGMGLRVLVAQHDPAMQARLREGLEGQGLAMMSVEDGREAIVAVERASFDAAVIDRELPGITGPDLAGFLRDCCPHMPVVLTAAAGELVSVVVEAGRAASRDASEAMRPEEVGRVVHELIVRQAPRGGECRGPVGAAGVTGNADPGALWAIVHRRGRRPGPGEGRSSLRHTLDRIALGIPVDRTVVKTDLRSSTSWIRWHDPDATVAVFPADQVVGDRQRFMERVADAARFIDEHPRWMVLLGAEATATHTGHGWIERAEVLGYTDARPVWRVRRVLERPSPERARVARARGALWNTSVFVANVATLTAAVRHAYAGAPTADLPRAVFEQCAPILAMMTLGDIPWSDRGTARRSGRRRLPLGIVSRHDEARPRRHQQADRPPAPTDRPPNDAA